MLPAPVAEGASPGALGRIAESSTERLAALKQHATTTYYRAVGPTPLAAARPWHGRRRDRKLHRDRRRGGDVLRRAGRRSARRREEIDRLRAGGDRAAAGRTGIDGDGADLHPNETPVVEDPHASSKTEPQPATSRSRRRNPSRRHPRTASSSPRRAMRRAKADRKKPMKRRKRRRSKARSRRRLPPSRARSLEAHDATGYVSVALENFVTHGMKWRRACDPRGSAPRASHGERPSCRSRGAGGAVRVHPRT